MEMGTLLVTQKIHENPTAEAQNQKPIQHFPIERHAWSAEHELGARSTPNKRQVGGTHDEFPVNFKVFHAPINQLSCVMLLRYEIHDLRVYDQRATKTRRAYAYANINPCKSLTCHQLSSMYKQLHSMVNIGKHLHHPAIT